MTRSSSLASDTSPVMPEVADGVAVRWVDVAAPWLGAVGGDARGTVLAPAIVARVSLRYDEAKADLVHDAEYEAVIFPLAEPVDASGAVAVDHDDRDLLAEPPANAVYRLDDAPIGTKSFFADIRRDLVDHLSRSLALEVPTNTALKLFGRPSETAEAFAARCAQVADERADAEIAKLRDKYESRATTLRRQIDSAEDRVDVLAEEAAGKRNSEMLSTAGSILGGLLGGRRVAGRAAGLGARHGRDGRRAPRSQPSVGGAGGRGGEQGRRAARRARGPGGRAGRRVDRDRRPMDGARQGHHDHVDCARAHRREGHRARSDVATRVLNISASASGIGIGRASRYPCTRCTPRVRT